MPTSAPLTEQAEFSIHAKPSPQSSSEVHVWSVQPRHMLQNSVPSTSDWHDDNGEAELQGLYGVALVLWTSKGTIPGGHFSFGERGSLEELFAGVN